MHLVLYRAFPHVGGISHTHSTYATAFAQARRPIPCLGTTHADHFCGDVPVTRLLTEAEVGADYEANTGKLIVETFAGRDPAATPAALVAGHGPVTWGRGPRGALENSVILESVAAAAWLTAALAGQCEPLPSYLADKHYQRKHGLSSYYGQKS